MHSLTSGGKGGYSTSRCEQRNGTRQKRTTRRDLPPNSLRVPIASHTHDVPKGFVMISFFEANPTAFQASAIANFLALSRIYFSSVDRRADRRTATFARRTRAEVLAALTIKFPRYAS